MSPKPQLLADDFVFLESPKWHGGRLWVSDVFDHGVYAVGTDGERAVRCEMFRPTGLGFLPDGRLVIVDAEERKLMQWKGGTLSDYADLTSFAAGHLNDFAVDGRGRIYVGDFGYDYEAGEAIRPTKLHRVDPDGTIAVAAEGLEFPNGSVVTNKGRTLVVAETWAGRITAFDHEEDGRLTNARLFADLGDRQPDGLCADAEGAVWAGCFNTGEFVRVREGGEVTHVIPFEGAAISCVLGGQDGRRLFMTTYAGTVDDIVARKRKSAISFVDVDVPAEGY